MSGSIVEPHDKMRGRDVNKVAKGEQAPRPPQRSPQVSRAPPPFSTTPKLMQVETETNKSLQSKSGVVMTRIMSTTSASKKMGQKRSNARRLLTTTNRCVLNGWKDGDSIEKIDFYGLHEDQSTDASSLYRHVF